MTAFLSGWRLRIFIAIILSGATGYLVFSILAGWREVASSFMRVGPAGIAIALALSLLNYLLRFFRWQLFLLQLGHSIDWPSSLRIYLAGFGLTILPGKIGETIRSVFLKSHNVSYPQSFAAFFSEHLYNLISILLLTCAGLFAYPQAQVTIITLATIILGGLIFLKQQAWHGIPKHLAHKFLSPKLARLADKMFDTILHSGKCLTMPMLLVGTALGLAAWGAEGIAFYYILQLLGSHISLQMALFIYSFSMLIGALSFLPGGLGGVEVTMTMLLLLNHTNYSTAVVTTILIRLTTLWFAVLLGIVAILFPERHSHNP